jgi:hypothetical protein
VPEEKENVMIQPLPSGYYGLQFQNVGQDHISYFKEKELSVGLSQIQWLV